MIAVLAAPNCSSSVLTVPTDVAIDASACPRTDWMVADAVFRVLASALALLSTAAPAVASAGDAA